MSSLQSVLVAQAVLQEANLSKKQFFKTEPYFNPTAYTGPGSDIRVIMKVLNDILQR